MHDQLFKQRLRAVIGEPEGTGNRGQHEIKVTYGVKGYEANTCAEAWYELGGDLKGEPGLSDASRTGKRDEGDVVTQQELADHCNLVAAANQRSTRHGERRREIGFAFGQGRRDQSKLRLVRRQSVLHPSAHLQMRIGGLVRDRRPAQAPGGTERRRFQTPIRQFAPSLGYMHKVGRQSSNLDTSALRRSRHIGPLPTLHIGRSMGQKRTPIVISA